jgi:hypothetical protein
MALAHDSSHRFGGGSPRCSHEERRHGRGVLAEVVPIRAAAPPRGAVLGGKIIRIARVFASLRAQAAPVDSPPPPPTSPAPLMYPAAPDDAA